jgi:hypothetical protein
MSTVTKVYNELAKVLELERPGEVFALQLTLNAQTGEATVTTQRYVKPRVSSEAVTQRFALKEIQ